jgi:hypothetical protein
MWNSVENTKEIRRLKTFIFASCKSEKIMCNRTTAFKCKGQQEGKKREPVIMKQIIFITFHAYNVAIIMCCKPDVAFVVNMNNFAVPR